MLEHNLSFEQLQIRPQVSAFDEAGASLKVVERVVDGEVSAVLRDESGSEKASIRKDDFGFLEVEDSRSLAGLRTIQIGPGTMGSDRIAAGELALELGPFEKVRTFGTRVRNLYSRVAGWTAGTSLTTETHEYSVREEIYGSYEIPQLELKSTDGSHVAWLVPIGAAVIAAEGRVEPRRDTGSTAVGLFRGRRT